MFDLFSKKNLPYFLYMAESEGQDDMVGTRLAKINAVGRELQERGYAGKVVPAMIFQAICVAHGVDMVSPKEIKYIEEKWL